MQEVFNNFDVNGDGTIDISELATILRSLGFNPSWKQLEVIMQQVWCSLNYSRLIWAPEFKFTAAENPLILLKMIASLAAPCLVAIVVQNCINPVS